MEGTMRAVCKMEPGLGFEWIDAPIPKPKMGEVLVKVHTTAICEMCIRDRTWTLHGTAPDICGACGCEGEVRQRHVV